MHPPAGRRSETRPPPRDGDGTARLEVSDPRTLASLYDRYGGAIYSLAMRITGEKADAEATVCGVFAAVWSEAARHPGRDASDSHWLLSMTRIRAIDHVRARSLPAGMRFPGVELPGDEAASGTETGDVATLHLPDPALGRVSDEQDPEDAPRLRAAFRGLPPLERLAVDLAYFEGLTLTQIAARLEQAPDAANARIRTALQRLAGVAGAQRMSEPRQNMPPTRDLAALYALGALNASERATFDAHLEVHSDSVDEVLSMLPVTRRLAWSVPPHEPPPGLRERVVATVTGAPPTGVAEEEAAETPAAADVESGSEPPAEVTDGPAAGEHGAGLERAETTGGSAVTEPAQSGDGAEPGDTGDKTGDLDDADPSASGGAETAPPIDEAAPTLPTPPVQQPIQTPQKPSAAQKAIPPVQTGPTEKKKKGGSWGLLLLAVVSLAAAAGLGVSAARQAALAAALQENLDAANTQAGIAELETAAARQVADQLRGGARVLAAADVRTIDLDGQPAASVARGRLYWSASAGSLFTATGLPPVPAGRVYQLWLIPDTTPLSAALLSVDAQGSVMAAATLPEGVTEPAPAAVTLEPAGGSTTPSGDVYLLGRP